MMTTEQLQLILDSFQIILVFSKTMIMLNILLN